MSYANELKQKNAYNDVALFYGRMYKIKMTAGKELTVMYSVVFSIKAGAPSSLTNSVFIKL